MNPKPIKIKSSNGSDAISLKIVGYKNNDSIPYISFEDIRNPNTYGYIEDRDIKRLLKWCQDCLKSRKNK